MSLQFDAPRYTIPVALRLVGHTVRVLPHPYVFYPVVDIDTDGILFPIYYIRCDIILMWHGKRHFVSCFMPVHKNGGLNMRTFQKEHDALPLP